MMKNIDGSDMSAILKTQDKCKIKAGPNIATMLRFQ